MANPFFNNNAGSGFNPLQNFAERFNQFRQTFQGDPRQKVEELLKSGQMSQEQFNQLYAKATEIYNSGMFQNAKNSGNPFGSLFSK